MARMNWVSMIAGAGIGAACAMTFAKRNELERKSAKQGRSIQSLTTDFLEEENVSINQK